MYDVVGSQLQRSDDVYSEVGVRTLGGEKFALSKCPAYGHTGIREVDREYEVVLPMSRI